MTTKSKKKKNRTGSRIRGTSNLSCDLPSLAESAAFSNPLAIQIDGKSPRKKKKKTGSSTPSTTSALKRKNSSRRQNSRPNSTHSKFFPSSGASHNQLENKIIDLETRVRDLGRDNQVLVRKLEKVEGSQNKKIKNLNQEKDMRLAANKERYWLRQKLNRLQLAIEARLKMLGIDFSNINDLGEALEAAFAAIQKLAAELAKKEEELHMMNSKYEQSQATINESHLHMDKLNRKMKKMKNALDESKKDVSDRDHLLKEARDADDEAIDVQSQIKKQLRRLKGELEKMRNKKNQQFDDFIDEKAELEKALHDKNRAYEELFDEMKAGEKQNKRLQVMNDKMNDEMERMRNLLDKQNDKLLDERERNRKIQLQADEEIEQLKLHMQQLNDENENIKEMLVQIEQKSHEMQEMIEDQDEELADYKRQMEEERNAKEILLEEKTNREMENNEIVKEMENELNDANELAARLKAENDAKDHELERMRNALKESDSQLDDYLNRKMLDKGTQTDINGAWFDNAAMKLANVDILQQENDELRDLAHANDVRLGELVDENRQLLDEIDILLKQQAQFKPCTSNHRGEIQAMCASPSQFIVATTATDKSVRVWRIDPSQAKAKDQVQVILRSQMEGVALSLAYTRDGKYLVAGCAYKNGPDGLLIVWDMTKGDGEVEFLFRSRPSIRFGRAYCVCWSDNSQYIFSGDTTGSIWVWDVVRQIQLAELRMHKDIVHDVGVARNLLFSCSLDQTLQAFSLPKLDAIKIKKSKVHIHQPKVFKGTQLDRNDKYAYWKVSPTADCKFVLTGSRRISSWTVCESKSEDEDCAIGKAPRISDTDMDHIQSLGVQRNLVSICRKNTPRAKIFDVHTGKEVFKARFKGPVSRIDFLHDFQTCVVCVQKYDGKKALAPSLHLWKYRK